MTVSALPGSPAPPPSPAPRPILGPLRFVRPIAAVAVPAALSMLALRFVLPSRLEGVRGGLLGFVARLADVHPLFVGAALFLALSEIGRYWARRARGIDDSAEQRRSWVIARPGRPRRRLFRGLLSLSFVVFFLRTSVLATFRIVGPSMLPTLEIGDRILTNRLAYGLALPFRKTLAFRRTPGRGELVVFRANGLGGPDGPQSLVKRVIGVPGDRVSFEQGSLYINDWRVPTCDAGPYVDLAGPLTVRGRLTVEFLGDRSYLTVRKPIETPFPGYVVKPGEVFVVGDDRGLSSDSRLWNEGRGAGVAIDVLEGRVSRVLFGARPDGRLDFSRALAPPLELEVRLPGLDLHKTAERIAGCLARRPANAAPPPGRYPAR